jgi:hypothetical protein
MGMTTKHRERFIPAGLLVTAALLLLPHPLACRAQPALVEIPDGEPMPEQDSGPDAGPDDAGDGGYHGDAGCVVRVTVDGGGILTPPGSWLNLELGSCTVCDPTLNPNGWTVLDSGQPCLGYTFTQPIGGTLTVPFEGVCGFDSPPFGNCGGQVAGFYCDISHGFGCKGGICGQNDWCEVDQNLGWFTACGTVNALTDNACASGPCCPDGGFGAGWCCGLVDGGISTCFPAGTPCLSNADCCPPLGCDGSAGTLAGDAGGSAGSCQ